MLIDGEKIDSGFHLLMARAALTGRQWSEERAGYDREQRRTGAKLQRCRDRRTCPFYRGEMYRSTVWRTRLDTTTNWSVVTTGIALGHHLPSAQPG